MTETTNIGAIDATGLTPAVKTDLAATAQANASRLGVTSDQLARAPDATRATFLKQAAQYGLTPPEAPKTGDAPTILLESKVGIAGALFPQSGISDAEAADAVANLQKNWTGDPAVLRDALNRAGVVQKQIETAPALDPNTLDPVLDPPAKLDGYKLSYDGIDGFKDAAPEAVTALDSELRQALHASGISMADASVVVQEGLKTGNALNGKSAAQINTHNQEVLKTVANIVGSDKLETTLNMARDALWRTPETIRSKLIANSFTRNVRVILSLASAQQRYLSRTPTK